MERAVTVQEAFTRMGASFSIVYAGQALLNIPSEELVQQVGCIKELLRGVGMLWSDMPAGNWYGEWLYTDVGSLSANAAELQTVFSPEQVHLIVRHQPNLLLYSKLPRQKTLVERFKQQLQQWQRRLRYLPKMQQQLQLGSPQVCCGSSQRPSGAQWRHRFGSQSWSVWRARFVD